MADVLNLATSANRNIIEDGTSPALTLENTSSGNTLLLQNAAGTGIQLSQISAPTTAQVVKGAAGGVEVYVGGTAGAFDSTGGIALNVASCPTTAVNVSAVGVAGRFKSTASESNVLDLAHLTAVASPTVAVVRIGSSAASGPAFEFHGGCIESTASGSVSLVAGVRVKFGNLYGWLPVYENIA